MPGREKNNINMKYLPTYFPKLTCHVNVKPLFPLIHLMKLLGLPQKVLSEYKIKNKA